MCGDEWCGEILEEVENEGFISRAWTMIGWNFGPK
jgi:hypothetical protein